jgi:hypothetical protein
VHLSVGVHRDTGAAGHASGGTVAEVAGFVELGTDDHAPVGFLRSTIDENRGSLARELADAGGVYLRGESLGSAFGPFLRRLVERIRGRVPVDTGTVRDAVQGRVNGERVA